MTVKIYDSLPKEALDIRIEVFVSEQGFIDKPDETDKVATHMVMYDGDKAKQEEKVLEIMDTVGLARRLAENGQVATQYVDLQGNPSMDTAFNPNGSIFAIEGITSPDGRVLGKMGHSERIGKSLYRNVPGEYDMKLFESAVKYFK